MTADEADALKTDLERAGVFVESVTPRELHADYAGKDEWQVRAWCEDPPHFYFVIDAQRFRRAVRDGLIDELARNALD